MSERELRDLGGLVGRGAWAEALEFALRLWRATRWWSLADLIVELGDRVPSAAPSSHGAWIERALAYDASSVTPLLARFRTDGSTVSPQQVLARGGPLATALREVRWVRDGWLDLLDRLAVVLQWPDDPRVARLLAELIHEWPFAPRGADAYVRLAAAWPAILAMTDRAIAIGDLGSASRIDKAMHRSAPPGPRYFESRKRREQLVQRMTGLPPPLPAAGDLLAMLRGPSTPTLDALWSEVAAHPDDLAPRLVLADALLAAGDPRGELIALQCAEQEGVDDGPLLERHWNRWLGELAPAIDDFSVFRDGMLSTLRLGNDWTPRWVYRMVTGHRELCVVDRLLVAEVTAEDYAAFVLALARLPRWVGVTEDIAAAWRDRGARLALHGAVCEIQQKTGRIATLFRSLRSVAPDLRAIEIDRSWYAYPNLVEEVRELPALFPRLEQITCGGYSLTEQERAALREIPLVEVR